ncbi:MAG: SIS domain-containing protein, partial [Collinsella sp.]|nr:SIS domain-containing protein [Collinsella sp.]
VVSSSYTSNEFLHATPAYVNENTLAVVVSMRGTKETIVAAQVAKDHGASTIAIYVDESALTEVCDYKIQYDSLAVDESCMGRTNSAVVTMIAMELTQQTEGYAEYETAMAAFDLVDPIYRKAVEYTRPLAAKWAEQNADKPCINVMAQGPLFGAAYVFSICNVQEMLQIDSCTINTCDFFHGPFEILDKRTSLFQLISVGRSRCNDERGIRFVNQYGGERVYQLDAKELGLNDIKDSVSEYFNHLIFAPILNNVYMRALSAVTHKDYMTRRYMWKLDY